MEYTRAQDVLSFIDSTEQFLQRYQCPFSGDYLQPHFSPAEYFEDRFGGEFFADVHPQLARWIWEGAQAKEEVVHLRVNEGFLRDRIADLEAQIPTEFDYEVYLNSDAWRAKRADALGAANHRCQVCNSAKNLNVHHRTYERIGDEASGDLTVLCRECHARHHGHPE